MIGSMNRSPLFYINWNNKTVDIIVFWNTKNRWKSMIFVFLWEVESVRSVRSTGENIDRNKLQFFISFRLITGLIEDLECIDERCRMCWLKLRTTSKLKTKIKRQKQQRIDRRTIAFIFDVKRRFIVLMSFSCSRNR